jgi:hypothetical protein
MKSTVEQIIKEAKDCLWQNTSMVLDVICERLYYEHGLNATWQGRSIYIDDARVASIETCKEAKDAVGIYRYKMIGG